jgi:hypothetical protein
LGSQRQRPLRPDGRLFPAGSRSGPDPPARPAGRLPAPPGAGRRPPADRFPKTWRQSKQAQQSNFPGPRSDWPEASKKNPKILFPAFRTEFRRPGRKDGPGNLICQFFLTLLYLENRSGLPDRTLYTFEIFFFNISQMNLHLKKISSFF